MTRFLILKRFFLAFAFPAVAWSLSHSGRRFIPWFMYFRLNPATIIVSSLDVQWHLVALHILANNLVVLYYCECVLGFLPGLINKQWCDLPEASRSMGCPLSLCGTHEHPDAVQVRLWIIMAKAQRYRLDFYLNSVHPHHPLVVIVVMVQTWLLLLLLNYMIVY